MVLQVCSNGARVFVHRSILDQFTEKLVVQTKALVVGNPRAEETKVGASISKEHVAKVLAYIDSAKQEATRRSELLCHAHVLSRQKLNRFVCRAL